MPGITIRVIAWKKDIEVNRYERSNCDYVQRRIPNANLRDLLEQTVFDLVHERADRMEWTIVPERQQSLFIGEVK